MPFPHPPGTSRALRLHVTLFSNWHPIAPALWLPLVGGAILGCSQDAERSLAPPPGPPAFSVEITKSENLTSIETGLLDSNGKAKRVLCSTCHDIVDTKDTAESPDELKEFHQGLVFSHGEMSCQNCHEAGDPLKLHLATGQTVPISQAMDLCSQCHGLQRRSYDHGAHGGMIGHWDLSRGPRLRNNCVDCHDPHTPQIPQVLPASRPIDRGASPAPGAHP